MTQKEGDYMSDELFIFILIVLLFVCFILLKLERIKERNNKMISKARKDMIDLESITKNIEETYKPVNIKLTSYEEEQENNAIISYKELLSTNNNAVNYEEYDNETDVDVKKIDLNTMDDDSVSNPKIEISLMSYEKEEAFLQALKKLQSTLAR